MRWQHVLIFFVILEGVGAVLFVKFLQKPAKVANFTQTPAQSNLHRVSMEKVTLKTKDSYSIAGNYYPAPNQSTRGTLLLHMMPATKESWNEFAPKLVGQDYHVLAIDLRGHGESQGGPSGYQSFSDVEHQTSLNDLNAGLEFLADKGVRNQDVVVIGASIGANFALQFLTGNSGIKHAILLSPGLNYRGIQAEPLMKKLRADQSVLLVGSDNDFQSNGSILTQLANAAGAGAVRETLIYKSAGHGTNMFGKELPDLAQTILGWLKR